MQVREVEHLIIGAGVAGLTLRHFLSAGEEDGRVAIVDPNPGGYKIGESLIPEVFRHPNMAALVPELQALPSFTAKRGTTFLAHGELAYFPIAGPEFGEAMHVARDEMERAMARAWSIDVTRAAVTDIDWARKHVQTDAGAFAVSGLILDCSGPAMVVARSLGEVEELLPGHATWAYYDVVAERPEALAGAGFRYLEYDVRHRKVLPAEAMASDAIVATTLLSMVEDGLWTWQIPLFGGRRLSYGVVARDRPISVDRYRAIAEAHVAPHFEIRRRAEHGDSPYDRVHVRSGFARRARRAADRDFILLADAFGFSDPVYSVGAGLAVSQAIEVAQMLTDGGWTEARCKQYVARCEQTLIRARRAFEYWYTGALLRDPTASAEVQDDFLAGGLFHSAITEHYGAALDLAALDSARDPFEVSWDRDGDRSPEARGRLGLAPDEAVAGWRLAGARPCAGGLQLRWTHADHPELTMLLALDERGEQPSFRRVGPLALSYMQLFDGPYPASPELEALFDAVAERARGHERDLPAL